NWFDAARSRSWRDDVRLLADEHRQLRKAIAAYPARALRKPVDRRKQSAEFTIRGIAAHDLYHAGQIQLLKKLQGRKAGGQKGRAERLWITAFLPCNLEFLPSCLSALLPCGYIGGRDA